jgi:hypothetical protein
VTAQLCPKCSATHLPTRGSDVEAWLKGRRDIWAGDRERWLMLDALLDDYRLRADLGRTLRADLTDSEGVL